MPRRLSQPDDHAWRRTGQRLRGSRSAPRIGAAARPVLSLRATPARPVCSRLATHPGVPVLAAASYRRRDGPRLGGRLIVGCAERRARGSLGRSRHLRDRCRRVRPGGAGSRSRRARGSRLRPDTAPGHEAAAGSRAPITGRPRGSRRERGPRRRTGGRSEGGRYGAADGGASRWCRSGEGGPGATPPRHHPTDTGGSAGQAREAHRDREEPAPRRDEARAETVSGTTAAGQSREARAPGARG